MDIRKPRFRSHIEFRTVADDVVCVKREDRFEAIASRLYPLLIPHIDGENTLEDIARGIGDRVTILDVQFGIEELAESGYIVDAAAEGSVAAARVAIHSLCAVDSAPLAGALRELGMEVGDGVVDRSQPSGESTIDTLIVDDYSDARIDSYADAAQNAGRPMLLAKPVGTAIWVGPVFDPPRTPCWQCLAARLRERPSFRIERELEGRGIYFERGSAPFLPTTLPIAWNLIASELWKWAGGRTALDDAILTFDLQSLELKKHFVTRRDYCAICGRHIIDANDQPVPIRLESRRKLFTADGGHRTANPEAVYERVARHVSPITGIVSEVQPAMADSSATVQVYWASHNHELRRRADPAEWVVPERSSGKGMTAAQARTGAVCEALERYSAIFRGDEMRRTATFRDLGDSAIHPDDCMLFSRAQYDNRETWNREAARPNWVPMPFDECRPVGWSALWSLTNQTFRYLPTAMCYFGYPAAPENDFCRVDSNGLAAGSNLEEAILQGYLELIERDSVAIWWYNQVGRPAVDLASFRQPWFDRLSEYYAGESRDLWALDLTGPFPVPVIAAVSARRPPEPADFLLGFGCHLDPELAVARALTELNQLITLPGRTPRLIGDDNAFLTPCGGPARSRGDFPEYRSDDLRKDVEFLTGLTAERGLETLLLNYTRPGIGLDVARVVVPGLRPFYARFAPGRLYDVPVEIGWLNAPLTEARMNPWPLVF